MATLNVDIQRQPVTLTKGVANGKSETRRDAETGILTSETETENFSDL